MSLTKSLIGKVFVSHCSQDKRFVRMLVDELEKRGYGTWLDEKELVVGDYLPKKIGQAINNAKIIIVVISEEALKSDWLSYELNHATELMIRGKCRLIPILISSVTPPPEITGIVYADFTVSFDKGMDKVLKALEHECDRLTTQQGFFYTTERLIDEVFDGSGYGSIGNEYKSLDYNYVMVKSPNKDEEEKNVAYEVVSSYGNSKPLSDAWWDEYREVLGEICEGFALVVSERPIGFEVDQYIDNTNDRISLSRIMPTCMNFKETFIITVDMSGQLNESGKRQLLNKAKEIIQEIHNPYRN